MQVIPHTPESPVLYFPHGGGPLPLLGDPGHRKMVDFLRAVSPTLPVPAAILVISAHWEEERPTITSGESPGLLYDYDGFPEEAYALQYPAPGSPHLAREVHALLTAAGFNARLDDRRGFDHGLFVPLTLMYPHATIPCIQLSLVSGLDAEVHLGLGRALAPLRKENILILGSGFSFHNMRAFFSTPRAPDPRNDAFQEWLRDTCTDPRLQERDKRLIGWEGAPNARYCHPREEHLIPLMVCCGVGGAPGRIVFDGEVLGKRSIAVEW